MTTFQDLPPQSRRSARQSERGERPDTPAGFDFTPQTAPVEPEASTETPDASLATGEQHPATGRRARPSAQSGLFQVPAGEHNPPVQVPEAEPLEYMTQGRDVPDSYRAPEPQQPPQPQFRVRDFSPEGRVSGRRAAAPPLIEPDPRPPITRLPSDLDYRTEAGPAAPPAALVTSPGAFVAPPAAPIVIPPISSTPGPNANPIVDAAPPVSAPAEYHTLSRRELRARLAQEEASKAALLTGPQDASVVTGPQSPALVTGPQDASLLTGPQNPSLLTGPQSASLLTGAQPPAPSASSRISDHAPASRQLSAPPAVPADEPIAEPAAIKPTILSSAMAEFDSLRTGQVPPPPAPSSRVTDVSPPAPASPALADLPAPTQAPVPAANAPFVFPPPPAAMTPPTTATPAFTPPATATPAFTPPAFDSEIEQTGGWSAPVGHWSRQADLDDEEQPWENTVTREVGGGNVATTTSALVLPEMPLANPFPSALTGTGEVLLTGSIDLPRSLSNGSGDSRHYDNSNVDLMYDDQDSESAGNDSAPVSAIRAVSTHTSARGVISSNKPHGNRMLTVLLVTASVMAVGVVVLLVAGLMGNVF